jgi:addiction module RelE/StbE family toxin
MYEVRFTKRFDKLFRKLDRQVQREILKEIENLRQNPDLGEKLHGTLSDFFKIRVKDHRVIYHIHSSENAMEFVFVDHRKRVYEELERLRREEVI